MEEENHIEAISQTRLIDDVDANGFLISDYESDNGDDIEIEDDVESQYVEHEVNIDKEVDEIEVEQVHGKEFDTLEDVYKFYNNYALLHGFGTHIHFSHKNRVTNEIYRKQYVCNKQGLKEVKDSTKKRRRDIRTGCKAMLQVTINKDGKWVVDLFNDVHNHLIIGTPTKVLKYRSHAKGHLSAECRSLVSQLNKSGLRPCQITKTVNVFKGTCEGNITSQQVVDILSIERKTMMGQQCAGLVAHIQNMRATDSTYYSVVDLDENGCLKSIFWADGRSRESYTQFGDVVVFDVTYMTNKFKMPFAPFVGVNHHGQTIIFGAALLVDEKEETFVWLFEQFLKCMFQRPPTSIITDQDGAMKKAISRVFPNTVHRFCAWHIKKHVLEHLQPLRSRYNDFQDNYLRWVKSETVDEFENGWEDLCLKYLIEEKSWLGNMYRLRNHWAKAFLKDTFFAGMTTSGRSESTHSFFDGYVHANTMLNEFIVQYDKTCISRRAAKEDEDFRSMNTKPVLFSINPIEVRAGECYTRNMFEFFKKEWIATNNCTHEKLTKNVDCITYRVGLMNVEKDLWRTVEYNFLGDFHAKCSCAMFETRRILCKHILYVMKKKQVMALPDYYILPRWTINARYKVRKSIGFETLGSDNGVSPLALWSIQANCNKAIEETRDSPTDIKKLNDVLLNFVQEQMLRKNAKLVDTQSLVDSCIGHSQDTYMPQSSIGDPVAQVKTKGRPRKPNRQKSGLELSNEAKKKRVCSYCRELGHNRTGCVKKKIDDATIENGGLN